MSTVTPRSFVVARLCSVSLCVALAACASLPGGARDFFVRRSSCPADRVTVVAIPDYQDPLPPDPPPPADVAADAGRLAVWRQQREAARKRGGNWKCGRKMYEVTGCGQRQLLCCDHPWVAQDPAHPGYAYDQVQCEAVTP